MANKSTVTPVKNDVKVYVLPETGQVIEANTAAEAIDKAQKQSKESKDNG